MITEQELDEQFKHAEKAMDVIVKFWKEENYTRKEMLRSLVNATASNSQHGIQMQTFSFIIIAERLIALERKEDLMVGMTRDGERMEGKDE